MSHKEQHVTAPELRGGPVRKTRPRPIVIIESTNTTPRSYANRHQIARDERRQTTDGRKNDETSDFSSGKEGVNDGVRIIPSNATCQITSQIRQEPRECCTFREYPFPGWSTVCLCEPPMCSYIILMSECGSLNHSDGASSMIWSAYHTIKTMLASFCCIYSQA